MRGVILDVDGTLVFSNLEHALAWEAAFEEARIDHVELEAIRRLIGMGSDKLLPAAASVDPAGEIGKRLAERRSEIFRERYLPAIRPTPGARELVEALRDRGLGLAVASSARPDELEALLARAGVPWLVDRATSADEVDASKPEPDVVEAALDRLELPADEVVMLGDTPYDLEAGRRAGVMVVAVRTGGWDEPELLGAAAVYADPGDLLARLESSPLA